MPKGHVQERDCICRACGATFRTTKVGKASFFCRTPECDEARGAIRRAETEAERSERQLARQREQEERRQRHAQEVAARRQQREADRQHRLRARAAAKRMRNRRIEMFRPILDDPEQSLLVDEFIEILRLSACERIDLPKQALREAIVRVAHAEGPHGQHAAMQNLAAVALKLADMSRPRATREPSLEDIERQLAAA